MLVEGNRSPSGWERDKRAGQGTSCAGEKMANEGISLYKLDNFCINKPSRKSWLHPSVEGEHCPQPLYYRLPQMAEAFCRAAEHSCCGGNQHGQGLTCQQLGMTTCGEGKTRGTAQSWTLLSSIHHGHQHRAGIFAEKQGLALVRAPSHLTGVFSTWKRVSGLSSEVAQIT